VIQLDPLEGQASTLDRDLMSKLLFKVESDINGTFPIHNPLHKLFSVETKQFDLDSLHFPLICKVNQAGGHERAHKMGIVFEEKGIHEFSTPIVAQEFFNHDGVLWKVFVVGNSFTAVKKKSIPNLPHTCKSSNKKKAKNQNHKLIFHGSC
jgi:inositol-1,3,4-trisphosphate 5/6-kinase/inositol-tetrakisphosphate 1-kinase